MRQVKLVGCAWMDVTHEPKDADPRPDMVNQYTGARFQCRHLRAPKVDINTSHTRQIPHLFLHTCAVGLVACFIERASTVRGAQRMHLLIYSCTRPTSDVIPDI